MKHNNTTNAWIRLCLGAWIVISPWILGFSGVSLAKWSNVMMGLIIVILSLWELFGDADDPGEESNTSQTNK